MMIIKCFYFICNSIVEYVGKWFVVRVIVFVEFDKWSILEGYFMVVYSVLVYSEVFILMNICL